jgi:hypothetical protein
MQCEKHRKKVILNRKNAAPPELKGKNNIMLQEFRSYGAKDNTTIIHLFSNSERCVILLANTVSKLGRSDILVAP